MPKVLGPYSIQRRSKANPSFIFSINPPSGLPPGICQEWQRRSFARLPIELSAFRSPSSMNAAKTGVMALIEFLKKEVSKGTVYRHTDPLLVGDWLVRFTSFDNNPRAQRLIADGLPYSPSTVDELYKCYYGRYIAGDPFLNSDINVADVPSTRAFLARIGMKKSKDGREIAGRRVYEITAGFVRMAFQEYWEDHQEWRNPFDRIKAPSRVKDHPRDVLQEDEILKLFMPDVITDPLERAVAVAMFWAGLRRAEIFGLKTNDLVWGKKPKLNIDHAWKRFGSKKKRTLGDPKWHKHREALFPEDLQRAIKVLQVKNGVHEFVFCYADGSIPHGKWIQERLPKWIKRAGIDVAGRKIVPHSARHSLASTLEAAGVPLRYIQDILGHGSLKTTLGYLHTPEGIINKITKRIDETTAQKEGDQIVDALKIG